MSDNEIPPETLVYCEQAYAEANERLDGLVENIRDNIATRENVLGIKDDSYHYTWLRDFIINNIAANGSLVTAVVCSAALFKLARTPQTPDPLAHLESMPTTE